MNEQILVIGTVGVLILTIIFTKINILHTKYFQFIFNLIFFSFVYLCFQYKYMDIMRKGMIIYGGIGLYYWFREWKEKKK